jgi:DNA-directed RNA polymerase subunit RPC12/RpoP
MAENFMLNTTITHDLIARLENLLASLRRHHGGADPYLFFPTRTLIDAIDDYTYKTSLGLGLSSAPNANKNPIITSSPPNSSSHGSLVHTAWPPYTNQQQLEVPNPTELFACQRNSRAPGSQGQVAEAAGVLHSLHRGDTLNQWHIDNQNARVPTSFSPAATHHDSSSASASPNQESSSSGNTVDQEESRQSPSSPEQAPKQRCCRTCGKDCTTTSSLDCSECTSTFGGPGKRQKYFCKDCLRSYTRAATLKEHLRVHSNEKPYKCSTCSKAFTRIKDRNRHQGIHNGERYQCDDVHGNGCKRRFTRKESLMAHFDTKIGAKCAEKYVSSFNLWLNGVWTRSGRLAVGNGPTCGSPYTEKLGCRREFKDIDELMEHWNVPLKSHCMKSQILYKIWAFKVT